MIGFASALLGGLLALLPAPQEALGPGARSQLHRVDLTGDGVRDVLAVAQDGSLEVRIHAGGRRYAPVPQELPRVRVSDLLVADLDRDGVLDVYLLTDGRDEVLQGLGSGHFRAATEALGLGSHGQGVDVLREDLDGDGLLDLLIHTTAGDDLFWARPDGTYQPDAGNQPAPGGQRADAPVDGITSAAPVLGAGGATGAGGAGTLAGSVGSGLGAHPRAARRPGAAPTPGTVAGALGSGLSGLVALLDGFYVNDDSGEVDAADVLDGSLIGADVSTTDGDVTHTGGLVGVGTTTPGDLFDVAGGAKVQQLRVGLGASNDPARDLVVKRNPIQSIYLSLQDDDTGVNEWELRGGGDASLQLWAGFDQRVHFQQDGRVGIGTVSPTSTLHVAGPLRVEDGSQAVDRVLTSDADGLATWGHKVAYGEYTPTWTSVLGFTNTPNTRHARYTRVGDLVTVVASFDFAAFAFGDNQATISLPPGLPNETGTLRFLVSGEFSSDHYTIALERRVGIVRHHDPDSSLVMLQLNAADQAFAATAWCSFTYLTSAD